MDAASRKWLDEARSVIDCPDHWKDCAEAGGATKGCAADQTLRWPGMVGPNYAYAAHRVMCIGQIHLANEWGLSRRHLGSLEPLMLRWIHGETSDDDFFLDYNREYADLLRNWGPWKKAFGPALEPFDIGTHDVVYVNFARCWADGTAYGAMDLCARRFPIKRLYDIVKPDAVIVLSGRSVFDAYPSLMQGVPRNAWTHFPGRRSFSMRTGDVALVRDWLRKELLL